MYVDLETNLVTCHMAYNLYNRLIQSFLQWKIHMQHEWKKFAATKMCERCNIKSRKKEEEDIYTK